jgi:hypothetical protein
MVRPASSPQPLTGLVLTAMVKYLLPQLSPIP